MIEGAKQELKRADHLIFVSLKYTRTMDVLASVIKRLISSLELVLEAILQWLLKKKKIKAIPSTYKNKIEVIRANFKKDVTIQEMLKFYSYLMRIDKAEHSGRSEFRKGVTLIAIDELGDVIGEINLEKIKEFYLKTIELVDYTGEMLDNKK